VPAPRLTVTVLGSGTSQGVPMIGCTCEVCRSTDPRDTRTRSSIFLDTPGAQILVDTTPEMRIQALRAGLNHVDAVLFTHPHADHIMGFDDLRRFCELQQGPLDIYGSAATLAQLERIFFYAFAPKKLVPGYVHVVPHIAEKPFTIGPLEITPLPVPHGAITVSGFLFAHSGRPLLAYLSDCKEVPPPVRELITGVDALIIDGLRDLPHPTHQTVAEAVAVAQAVRARRTFLTHQTHEKKHVDRQRDLPSGIDVAHDGLTLVFEL
jgi:phosphoribosyl 1,2-cyclic phosphate phosphodiesterase